MTASKSPRKIEFRYTKVMDSIFELILRSGVPPASLERACAASLRKAISDSKTRQGSAVAEFVVTGLVLDAWHRDPRYVDKLGNPKAVPLMGYAPSVEALVRAQRAGRKSAGIAQRLRDLRLIAESKRGRYRPISDVAVISSEDPIVIEHTAKALSTLLETVGRNISHERQLAPLIERVAEIPDLPQKYIQEFERFTQVQGRIFIRTVNDWLEARRATVRRGRKLPKSVRAGVHAYAYVASAPTGAQSSI